MAAAKDQKMPKGLLSKQKKCIPPLQFWAHEASMVLDPF
jgi:hypothetical protein